MTNTAKLFLHLIVVLGVLVLPRDTSADQFDRFRNVIDNYHKYSLQKRETVITELEATKTSSIEKKYLLGMLYFIQGTERMKVVARAKKKKPKVEEVLRDKTIQAYFQKAKANYDVVESRSPGYKYIYCKYGELYRYSFNENGLRKVARLIGKAAQNDRTKQCKAMLENAAEQFARYGHANLSKVIYEEAVKNWRGYPKYMIEALGDIAKARKDKTKSRYWWNRCVKEAERSERKKRCVTKIIALSNKLELWLGKVEFAQLRDAKNKNGKPELVIEWLVQRYKPLENINMEVVSNSDSPIKAIPIKNEYFVNTIRTQEMPRKVALKLVKDANEKKPTVVRFATKQFVGKINNKTAVFIGGGSGGIYTNKLVPK